MYCFEKNRKGKQIVLIMCVLIILTFSACGKQEEPDYSRWISTDVCENSLQNDEANTKQKIQSTTDTSFAKANYNKEELKDAFFESDSDGFAEMIWQNQIANGVYSVTEDEIEQNTLTYYVSSSEGDDENFGLSPDAPKKTLEKLSGVSNITVLLKCGDVFDMPSSFVAGSNCIYATYGQGSRPEVNYYIDLDLEFSKVSGCKNVWQADLTGISQVYTGEFNKDNCNIGQLVIDGEVNWKRIVVSSNEAESGEYDFAKDVENKGDGCWSVDWLDSVLYIHSQDDPSRHQLKAAPDLHGIIFEQVHDTVLKGWKITGAGAHGINMTANNHVCISSCYLENIGGSIHRSAGIRYGNGIQIWDGGVDITVTNNYVDWVFDSCFTDQGTSESAVFDNVLFAGNIGSHSFIGIESWGDGYPEGKYENVEYSGNILYSMCDITDPEQPMYAAASGGLTFGENYSEDGYVSYRGGYNYNQMSCLNTIVYYSPKKLKISGNVFWNTNRFLMMSNRNMNMNSTNIVDNLFYAEIDTPLACLFRYKDEENNYCYLNSMVGNNNKERIYILGGEADNTQEMQALMDTLLNIANDAPQME